MTQAMLIGNGLAMLVAAAELAQKGQAVVLLTDGKRLGGHFGGIQLDGYDFDVGMVLLEENDHADVGADLGSYDPTVRNDWQRFGGRVSTWMRSRVDLVRAKSPECLVGERRIPDYLISNRLDALVGVPKPKSLSREDPMHASNKCAPGLFDSLTYAQAALANHGHAFHDQFIEPFVNKVFGRGSDEFLARFHRTAWVPLYYPETLQAAFDGQPTGLSEYPFWTTPGGSVAQLVRDIEIFIKNSPHVTVVEDELSFMDNQKSKWVIATQDGRTYSSEKVAIGLPPNRATSLLNVNAELPDSAASVAVLFAVVDVARIQIAHGCTMIVDASHAAYRLTDHDALAGVETNHHRITLEASPLALARMHPDKTEHDALCEELADLIGIDMADPKNRDAIRMSRHLTARDALSVPTPVSVAKAGLAATAISRAASGAILSGSLLDYGATSMNDQIVQGLGIAEQFV